MGDDPFGPDWRENLAAGLEQFLRDRDFAYQLMGDRDLESHLDAIDALLAENARRADRTADEVRDLDEQLNQLSGEAKDYVAGQRSDLVYRSFFHEAAQSMAAVGMVAPFVESLFHQTFQHLGKVLRDAALHEQSDSPPMRTSNAKFWDCHYYWKGRKELKGPLLGIDRLARETGLNALLPADLRVRLSALFEYRNCMFHNGFEWPVAIREDFVKKMAKEAWPAGWFECSFKNGQPWIYCMSEPFIASWGGTMQEIVDAVGRFARALPR